MSGTNLSSPHRVRPRHRGVAMLLVLGVIAIASVLSWAMLSAATVRGTTWLTEDRCDSTLIRVTQGAVDVRALVKRKTVLVRKGKFCAA